MAIHFNGNQLKNVFYGQQQVQKVYYGTKLVWENWVSKTGSLFRYEQTWKDTNFGLFYDTGDISLGRTMKLRQFRCLGEALRVDINGRTPLKIEILARRTGTTTWDMLASKITSTTSGVDWNTEFSIDLTSNTEYDAVRYKLYVNDTISRSYKARGYVYLSSWIQKGA